MGKQLNKLIKILLPRRIKDFILNRVNKYFEEQTYTSISYAQEGEDLIVNRFFDKQKKGFYIDVGAHHPKRFSNTYFFYKKGWSGINIDPMPEIMTKFKSVRPRDINLELGVSDKKRELLYYMFNESALNTFSKQLASQRDGFGSNKLIGEKLITISPLSAILKKYLKPNQSVDFLTIDVEGLDLQVLKSNDWSLYRPKLILVECLQTKTGNTSFQNDEIIEYLISLDYMPIASTINTSFFKCLKNV